MNVQSEGLGLCNLCGGPIMQAIGQPGIKGVCLGCQAAAQPKTGKTVVVTSESGEGTALGKITLREVEHNPGEASALPKDPAAVRKAIMDKANAKGITTPPPTTTLTQYVDEDTIQVPMSLKDLEGTVIKNILQRVYDALDNLPPGKTLKETKRLIKMQDTIEKLIKEK